MAHLIPNIIQKFFDADGEPLVGGKLYSYQAGTSTPLATYQDANETAPNTNPIILDANGECRIWIGANAYKFVLEDPEGNILWTEDNVSHLSPGSVTTDKIANGAVTYQKIADNAVIESKIAAGSVTNSKIGASAVTESKIANSAVTTPKIADSAVTTAKVADGAVTLPKMSSEVFKEFIQAKNKIINGDFEIWQRGTSFTGINSGAIFADRWKYQSFGGALLNATASSDAPTFAQAGRVLNSSMSLQVSTADGSIGNAETYSFFQVIEGYYFKSIAQGPMTLSFWVKAPVTGKYCVNFSNYPHDLSFICEYEVLAANTWEFKSVTCPGTPAGGTWFYDSGPGLRIEFVLGAGSDFQDTPNTWISGVKTCTSSQVNSVGTIGNTFLLTGVQLESGSIATKFESRHIAVELEMAKRYFERIDVVLRGYNPNVAATGCIGGFYSFSVEKRDIPPPPVYTPSFVGSINSLLVVNATTQGAEVAANFTASGAGAVKASATMGFGAEYA